MSSLREAQFSSSSDNLHKDARAVRAAWSAQGCLETSLSHLVDIARQVTGQDNICLAGGVALNCSANGRILEPIYIPPVPHDAGVALGAAWCIAPPQQRGRRVPLTPFLGAAANIATPSRDALASYNVEPLNEGKVVEALVSGKVGALVEGRAEIGPRSLGHRSILALPAELAMRDRLNLLKKESLGDLSRPWH